MANILITGGLGFVGTQASYYFLERGHSVTLVDHYPSPRSYTPKKAVYVFGDTTQKGKWQEVVSRQDIIINLAGASIFQRWNESVKKKIYETRIKTTENVVEAIGEGAILINASAIGYYGDGEERILTENDPAGSDFLATVCIDWEKSAWKAESKGARVVITRFGIILGKGGALEQMVKNFKMGIGGPLGSGNQWFSWIHIVDLLRAMDFCIANSSIRGSLNLTSPNPVRNKELAKAIGEVLRKPSFFKTPAFILKLVLGEFSSALLSSQRVKPERLLKYGFEFKYPHIKDAIASIIL